MASKNSNFRSTFEELRPPVSNMTLNNDNNEQKTEYNNFVKHPSTNSANQQRIFTEESRTTSGDTPFETTEKN